MRRQVHEAGKSWRKWTDPLVYGSLREEDPGNRRRVLILWYVTCILAGAVLALLLTN